MRASAYLCITNVPSTEWSGEVLPERQLIGRGEDVPLRVPARFSTVSRHHAEIWTDRSGALLRDVGSTGGTLVNGIILKPQQDFHLAIGDKICLGGLELQLVNALPPASTSEETLTDNVPGREQGSLNRRTAVLPDVAIASQLTHAELEVILWMSRGFTSLDEIAKKLFRSPHTVRTQLGSIYQKLGIHGKEEVIGWFQRHKLSSEFRAETSSEPPL